MADNNVENYKKSVEEAVAPWDSQIGKVAKGIDETFARIAKLEEASKQTTGEEKKKTEKEIEFCNKQNEIAKKITEDTSKKLRDTLLKLEAAPEADEKELVKIPAWLKENIKKKGDSLSKYGMVVPEATFDAKAKKLKSFSVTVKWKF